MYPLLRAKLNRAWHQLRETGPFSTAARVYRDWSLGRQIEANGNRVEIAGLTISVDNGRIGTRAKSTLASGTYEHPEMRLIERFLPRDLPVIELGGSIGVVACCINRRLDAPERHIVVEAHPELIPTLRENARLNSCRFEVINAAVAYDTPSVTFYSGPTFLAGSLRATEGRSYKVQTITLSSLLARFDATPVCLVADIEGSEQQLIERELDALRRRVHWIILETHPGAIGGDAVARMVAKLADVGFVQRGHVDDVLAMENTGLRGDEDGN